MNQGSNWAYNTVSSSSSATYTFTAPMTYYSSGSTAPVPRPKTALEWLDDEIEAVCKLARQAA